MARIRPFVFNDIENVVRLYRKIHGSGSAGNDQQFCEYLDQLFFKNPWVDSELPCLVYQDESGALSGFLGVIPRRMTFKGQPIRVAVSNSFMVDPSRRNTLAAVELQKAFFSGPQDLSFTDGANEPSRVIWERLGGIAAPLYSLWWARVLRPGQFVVNFLRQKSERLTPLTYGLKPASMAADLVAGWVKPNDFEAIVGDATSEELTPATLLQCIPKFAGGVSLTPEYDQQSLSWLLAMAELKRQYGVLRRVAVRSARGDVIGWYLYYQKRAADGHVLQFMARKDSVHQVLNHLFLDASRLGSSSLSGRFEPRFMHQLSENYCYFRSGTWMLIHSGDPELMHAICRGDAFLTWLEGERWTKFLEFLQ